MTKQTKPAEGVTDEDLANALEVAALTQPNSPRSIICRKAAPRLRRLANEKAASDRAFKLVESQLAEVTGLLEWAQEKRVRISPAVYMNDERVWMAEHSVSDFLTQPTILAALRELKKRTEGE